jgi:hypothetical protein
MPRTNDTEAGRKSRRNPVSQTDIIPWQALVDSSQARRVMNDLYEAEEVRNACERLVDEFHNNTTFREFCEYMGAQGDGRPAIHEPAVQELMIRSLVDNMEIIWHFWNETRGRLIKEIGTQRAISVESLHDKK